MSIKRCVSVSVVVCLYNQIDGVDTVSITRFLLVCASGFFLLLYNHINEIDRVSHLSVKRCVSVSLVQLHCGNNTWTDIATNRLNWPRDWFCENTLYLRYWISQHVRIVATITKKSHVRETKNLLTDVDSNTNTKQIQLIGQNLSKKYFFCAVFKPETTSFPYFSPRIPQI